MLLAHSRLAFSREISKLTEPDRLTTDAAVPVGPISIAIQVERTNQNTEIRVYWQKCGLLEAL
jgi:hypothetical protein